MPKINVVNADNIIEYNPQKAYFKLKNTGGPKGDKGDKGDTGPQGPQGIQGPKGDDGAPGQGINVQGTVATYADLPAGLGPSDAGKAYLVSADGKLYIWSGTSWPADGQGAQFEGPQGPQGETGPAGQDGADGQPGQAATIAVGATTTLPAGQSATVTNSGTSSAAVFDFGIPKGADADPAVTQKSTTAPAYITDAGFAIKSLDSLEGNTSQNGTPTPDAPVPVQTVTGYNVVKICGKNLFDKNNAKIVAGTIGSTSISIGGYNKYLYIPCDPSTTYTVQKRNDGDQNRFCVAASVDEPTSAVTVNNSTQNNDARSITITTSSTSRYLLVMYYRAYETTLTEQQLLNSIQIEKGSMATTYQAFQGQSYEINLGKNLANMSSSSGGSTMTYSLSGSVAILNGSAASGNVRNTAGIGIYLGAGTYTFSAKKLGGSADSNNTRLIFRIGSDTIATVRTDITGTGMSASFTVGARAQISLQIYADGATTANNLQIGIQIEKGSQATSYAAYFTPIELCKLGTYQDYIYPSGGKWYIHKATGKTTFDGTEDWFKSGSTTSTVYVGALTVTSIGAKVGTAENAKCANFIYDNHTPAGTFAFYNGTTVFTNIRFCLDANSVSDLTAFKNWLGSNNIAVYYALYAPTDTEITNATLIAQLEAVNNAALYNGISNVAILPAEGNEQAGMDFTYWTWYKGEPGPTPNNGTLTIQKNGADVQTFSADQSSNVTANITVPTTVSELSDASNYALQAQLSKWFNMGTVTLPAYGTKLFFDMSNNDFTRFKLLIVGSLADNVSGAWVNITTYTGTSDSYTAQDTDGMLITLDSNGATATPWSSAATTFSMTGLATANKFSAECLFAQNSAGDPVKFEIKSGVHQKGVLMATGIIPSGVKPNGFLLESNGNIAAGTSITLWCYAD